MEAQKMSVDLIAPIAQLQSKTYALQSLLSAMLVRHFEQVADIETEAREISEIALGTIRKFDIRDKSASNEQIDAAAQTNQSPKRKTYGDEINNEE